MKVLALLLKNDREDIERFDPGVPLPELVGVPLFKKMAKIKKISPEAYYYFAKTQEMQNNQ